MNNFEKPMMVTKKEKMIPPFEIFERAEALNFIKEKYESGERPIVTVPRKYVEYLKQGLKPYTTWTGLPLIAATFGREPYNSEDRIQVEVTGIPLEQIMPRKTGENDAFCGVVILNPPIPPESIRYSA
ncbi:MAG: hypothetical protein MRY57_02965 [Candidatus Pacebacteria bacterium]|nr:hypothetical protein [Candidatus Paceibacterota bacterium]